MAGLTEQQRKALQLDKHISLTANAGSGKTRVLVERYLGAVRGGIGVEQILCLTFTEKAALELRQKIGERIVSEYREARAGRDAAAAVFREARDKMLEANISTIHSFCSQILREFPVEAGVDANFKVLEDFDSSSLKEEACTEAIREMLARERPQNSQGGERKVHDLLVKTGYGRVLRLLADLLDNREKIEHVLISGGRTVIGEETVRKHWFSLARAATDVIRYNVSRKKGDFSAEVNALDDAVNGDPGSLAPVMMELKATLDKVLTKKGTVRKRDVVLEGGSKYSSEDALAILRTVFDVVEDVTEESLSSGLDDYLKTIGNLFSLYEKSEEIYSRRKYLMGALDFDDLQILTLRLLTAEKNVRETLVSRFRHVMVDEFQDTNFLQYGIFLRLLDDLSSDARLFVVGDPKQSIYRFRNAQVEVSRVATERLAQVSDGLSLPLSESFRMNSDIAAFVNDVFGDVLKRGRVSEAAGIPSMSQTGYDALIPRRPGGAADPVEIFVREKHGARNNNEEQESDGGEEDEEPGDTQAMFTAARIRQMVDSHERMKSVRDGEKEREVGYADVAVLLRTRSRLPALENALTKYGVPYVVSAGIGFYTAQEIFDLSNYLTFLLDNKADIPLLAVLRSPFFGISENELYAISQVGGASLFERLIGFAGSDNAGKEVKYAASVLGEEAGLAHRQTIPELINRILERTGWLGAFRLSPTADQRIANLRKLLSIAREFEGRGFNSLFDFVERIKYLKETAHEGQAPVEEAADAVKIMTVHAAKGLEFPVVFIPFCDSTTRRESGMLINDQVGILPFVGDDVPPALSLYKQFETMSEQAEMARLFYVACTRAMDKLVLTTSTKKSTTSMSSFTDILVRSMNLSEIPDDNYLELNGSRVRLHSSIPGVEPLPERKAAEDVKVGDLFLDSIPANIDGEIYSATVLQTYRLCPTKYFLRYRLGMPVPETGDGRKQSGDRKPENGNTGLPSPASGLRLDEYDETILSTVKGQLVHSVLEYIIKTGGAEEAAIKQSAKRVVSAAMKDKLGSEARSGLEHIVAENAGNAVGTLDKIAGTGKRYTEQTITRKFNSDYLTGTLDLLIEDEKGYHIYDYKTNRLDRSQEEIYAGYEIQMKLYASLCGNLKPGQSEIDVTIVFTREPGKYLRRVYSKNDLETFENEIKDMLSGIKGIEREEGMFPSADTLPTVSPHCGECEFFVGDGSKKGCLLGKRKQEARNKK